MRTIPSSRLLTLSLLLVALPLSPALAQGQTAQQPDPADPGTQQPEPDGDTQIIVTGRSLRGQVDAPQPPLLELGEEEIAAYGAGSIAELIEALSPQVSSGSGRGAGGFPVILVNGARISSFRELRSYPPEAIEKVEVFPEEVAQRYGYSADQRVVNIILKQNYASREIEAEYGQPFDGGYSRKEVEGTYLRIDGQSRLNINLGWQDGSLLTEAERDIVQAQGSVPAVAGDPDPAQYRSLVSDTAEVEATANWTTQLSDDGASLSLNGTFERANSLRLQGLNSVTLVDPLGVGVLRTLGAEQPLAVDSRTTTYALGSALNAPLGDWQLAATLDASRAITNSRIDGQGDTSALVAAAAAGTLPVDADLGLLADAGFDQADTTADSASGKVTAIGRPLLLPAGEVALTLDAGYGWTRIASEDTRTAGEGIRLTRGDLNAGANLSVPIASVRDDVLAGIGDLTLNASAGIDYLSDFGTLLDWSTGLTWGPTETLTVTATYIGRDAAPSLSELGNPEIATPNVQVYDLTTGETVLATIITGGNPLLPSQSQRDWKLGLNWQLPFLERSNLSVEYFNNHSEDVSASFPLLTPTTEAAFPGRVTRDAAGRLVSIDQRPVTFAQQDSQRVQFGLNLSGPFGSARPQAEQGGGGGPLGAIMSRAGAGARPQGATGATGARQGAAPNAAPGAAAGTGFDQERFGVLRERLCTRDAQGALTPLDLSPEMLVQLPEPLRQRLLGEDGQVDPERLAAMRERFCSTQGPGVGPDAGQGGFAALDPQAMAALRQRFCVRDADGNLTALDLTEENIAQLPERLQQRLRGEDGQIDPERVAQFRQRICDREDPTAGQAGQAGLAAQGGAAQGGSPQGGPPPAEASEARARAGADAGAGAGAGAGGGGARAGGGARVPGVGGPGGGDGRGRWFANLTYRYEIENEVLVAPGGPLLDLLSGDALSGGGDPRHSASLQGGIFYRGFGTRLSGEYTGSSQVDGSGLAGSSDLFFDDIVEFDIRFFVDFNQRESLLESVPLLKGTRITLAIDNIFDTRQRVTNNTGEVPLAYQPFRIDPTGRFFEIELRKLF